MRDAKEVHLYGPTPPPGWLMKMPLDARFVYHNGRKLFRNDPITRGLSSLNSTSSSRPIRMCYNPSTRLTGYFADGEPASPVQIDDDKLRDRPMENMAPA